MHIFAKTAVNPGVGSRKRFFFPLLFSILTSLFLQQSACSSCSFANCLALFVVCTLYFCTICRNMLLIYLFCHTSNMKLVSQCTAITLFCFVSICILANLCLNVVYFINWVNPVCFSLFGFGPISVPEFKFRNRVFNWCWESAMDFSIFGIELHFFPDFWIFVCGSHFADWKLIG